jgi:nucleotide-binding universal stress UspA family protein
MPGVILAIPQHPDRAGTLLAAAECLGRLTHAARINVLAIRMPPEATVMVSEEILTHEEAARLRTVEQRRTEALQQSFLAWSADLSARSAMAAEWSDLEGNAGDLVDEWGRRADFIVLERPSGSWLNPDHGGLSAALFGTDGPVLIVPPATMVPFGRRIAIAWRDDKRAVKAVIPLLRCLAGSEEVHVLTGVREKDPPPAMPAVLREHGIPAQLLVLPIGHGSFGQALLDAAHRLSADLLVMGAYAHSPLRELILGGVTRTMLDHADIPVLLRH